VTPDQLAPITPDHRAVMELTAERDIARAEAAQFRQQIEDDSLVYGLLRDERDAIARERDEAQAEVKRLKARAVDHAHTAEAFTAIADIYDRFVDGDLTPYDAIQAVGEQVGDR
jgi:uncharacterized coiled-coil DUF342 family protein